MAASWTRLLKNLDWEAPALPEARHRFLAEAFVDSALAPGSLARPVEVESEICLLMSHLHQK